MQRDTLPIPFEKKNEPKMILDIFQTETNHKPWAIHAEGYRNATLDVILYHEDIGKCGAAYFNKVKSSKFVEFVWQQLKLFEMFPNTDLVSNGRDLAELIKGYQRGVATVENVRFH